MKMGKEEEEIEVQIVPFLPPRSAACLHQLPAMS